MTDCNAEPLLFASLKSQKMVADFAGGRLTSDGGGLLLREVDRKLKLTRRLAACLSDPRDPGRVIHDQHTMLAQRVFGIALGYEDLNDHDTLRSDPLFSILAERGPDSEQPLASSPTLCRLENRVEAKSLIRRFHEIKYAAATWDRERRVIVKAERLPEGPNVRFVITNLAEPTPEQIYDGLYIARGDMENRIKEQQLGLFADRTSCHKFIANQFRLLLASAAYVLIDHLRRTALARTDLRSAQVETIRLKLFKVAARIITSVRRVVFHLSSSYPYQPVFRLVAARLVST